MALATAGPDGRPSVRMVLLKGADELGFAFHTNYESREGRRARGESTRCAPPLLAAPGKAGSRRGIGRAPAVGGVGRLLSVPRPLGSRLAAWASPQSRPLANRDELERLYAEAAARFPGESVPRPQQWGGFRLAPEAYEFWQHAENRLHDRIRYERDGDAWTQVRLAPYASRARSKT